MITPVFLIKQAKLKEKVIQLLEEENYFKLIEELKKDSSIAYNSFLQSKTEFLEIMEVNFNNNEEMGFVVKGLKELIAKTKNTQTDKVCINLFNNSSLSIAVYTNESFSVLLGII